MLYSEETVRSNIRNRAGKRVFYLRSGDTLTPSARDWLRREQIDILPAELAKPEEYHLLSGGILREKPEHFTHLRGDLLVPKTHPIIAFRGAMDTLQSELLLAQAAAPAQLAADLQEILDLTRRLLRSEVMEEPVENQTLCGLTAQQQRSHSHRPQDYYGQPHFMPHYTDGAAMLQLNRARCAARSAELAAARAFTDENGLCSREDLLQSINRMSSMLYILMIRRKAGGYHE